MKIFCTLLTRILTVAAPLLLMIITSDSSAQVPTSRFRVAHMISGVPMIDAYVNGGTTPYLTDVPFESQSARSASFPITLRLVITRADAGPTAALIDRTMVLEADRIYSFIAYGTASAAKLAALPWRFDQVPPPSSANLRVFNATTLTTGLDVYFDSTTGTPSMTNITMDSASQYVMLPAGSRSLILTQTGSTTPLARFVAPLGDRSIQTFIVTGSTGADLAVNALNEGTQAVNQAAMTALQREQAVGAAPTLRVLNAFAQPDARRLDVYLNGTTRAAQGINYRGASGVLPGVGVGPIRVTLVPENRGSSDSVYGTTMTLARDTAYILALTQFRSGMAVAMSLKRSLSEPAPQTGFSKVRLANLNDFHTGLSYQMTGSNSSTIAQPAFLTATGWHAFNAGPVTLRVFKPGITAPFYEGQYTIPEGTFLTLLAIGDETRFAVDVLRHDNQGEQNPMESFGQPESSVREQIAAAARAMRLSSVPNPVSDVARISFELPRASSLTIELFDAIGRSVRTIAGGSFPAGRSDVRFDADGLASGAYTCVLRTGSSIAAMPIVVTAR